MTGTSQNGAGILIVEDERIVAKDLQQTLAAMGYDPFAIASSGDEAIAHASERCPDLVLMDIRIKGLRDGIQTAEVLKGKFDLPVVYLTAHADEATIRRARITEPHGYLVKPVKSAELRSCIEVSLFKHKMERRLRERERWFSATMNSIADAVLTVDMGGKVTYLNPAAETLIGLRAGEIIGKHSSEVVRLAVGQSVEIDETPLRAAPCLMHPVELQEATPLNLSTGEGRLIGDRAAPVTEENMLLGAVMVFHDITEQKRQEKRLEFTERLASLGTMAAGVAHELNNPLSVVVGYAELAAEGLTSLRAQLAEFPTSKAPEQRLDAINDALAGVQAAAGRMSRIISDLRAFSRPAQETPGLIDLAHCVSLGIHATVDSFRGLRPVSTRIGVTPLVQGDEGRLEQVIINLLTNATHAASPDHEELNHVSITTLTDDQGRAVLEVRDTGTGIPDDILGRIFDPFFTTKDPETGTGLGLSICQGIVRSLGGEITVDSHVGKGTTFRVLLPAASPGIAQSIPTDARTELPLRGRILVIDDEETILRIVQQSLESADHMVVCARDGEAAFALIERGEKFDVILSDMRMANMTGMAFYEKVLIQRPHLAQRIVFMTGGTTGDTSDFLRSIPNDIIEKPFRKMTLLAKVQEVLVASQRESETRHHHA